VALARSPAFMVRSNGDILEVNMVCNTALDNGSQTNIEQCYRPHPLPS